MKTFLKSGVFNYHYENFRLVVFAMIQELKMYDMIIKLTDGVVLVFDVFIF